MAALPIKVAAIGLGWVTCHRHIPAIERNPDLQLVGVIDPSPGRASLWARRLNLPHHAATPNLDEIPWLYDVDAVTIGAPPALHKDLCISALKHGKHVLTEKPFALSVTEGEDMIAAAKDAGKTLSVVHNFQFSRAATKLQADLKNGKLGKVQNIAATQLGNPNRRLPSWYETLPLGLFYDESPHFYYLLSSLTNGHMDLVDGYCLAGTNGKQTPNLIHLLYKSADNIPVTIDCQFDSAISEWFIRVTGDKAVAFIDIFRDIYIRLPNDKTHGAWDILQTSLYAFGQHFWQHIPNGFALLRGTLDYGNDEIMRRFASAVKTGQEDNKIGFTQALAVLKLQHEAISKVRQDKLKS